MLSFSAHGVRTLAPLFGNSRLATSRVKFHSNRNILVKISFCLRSSPMQMANY